MDKGELISRIASHFTELQINLLSARAMHNDLSSYDIEKNIDRTEFKIAQLLDLQEELKKLDTKSGYYRYWEEDNGKL